MKKAAVITANGIGDGIIMMIASNYLKKLGYHVTVFNQHLEGFQNWFEGFCFDTLNTDEIKSKTKGFDLILVQHDNSKKAQSLVLLKRQGIYFFYTNYRLEKHGLLDPGHSFIFDQSQTMVSNVMQGLKHFFCEGASKENGLKIPQGLIHRKYSKRVILHPSSSHEAKNWPKEKYVLLAKKLTLKGYDPYFVVSSQEEKDWEDLDGKVGFCSLSSLSDLCDLIFESGYFIGNDSGPAHIASCLQIPSLVLAKRRQAMKQWKPDWLPSILVFPPRWIPNSKAFRIRDRYWKQTITTGIVLKKFIKLTKTNY